MAAYVELEIGLHRSAPGRYDAMLRFNDPESNTEKAPVWSSVEIAVEDFIELQNDSRRYGEQLTARIFQHESIVAIYRETKAYVAPDDRGFRLRLMIDSSALELQALRWELLVDPDTKVPLATSPKIYFSRFVVAREFGKAKPRPRAALSAVVAVAAPTDFADYNLSEIHPEQEIARVTQELENIGVVSLGKTEPLTLARLREALRKSPDIVYLVCHGLIVKNEPYLFLQDDAGKTARVRGRDIEELVGDLPQTPRLIVLASCESAGTEDGGETMQASLAPRLANVGVPAVLAMQGKISVETMKAAMPVFFRELLVDGQIDRAMSVAREEVRGRPDAWMPALFLRLRGGCIWYEPGFTGERDRFEQWRSICRFVRRGEFVPVLGPDLSSDIFGSPMDLAQELGHANGFPLTAFERADPAKVAQFLEVKTSRTNLRNSVEELLQRHLRKTSAGLGIQNGAASSELESVVKTLYKDEYEPWRILANLDAKVYVSAGAIPVLSMFLRVAGKSPVEIVSNWRDERRGPQASQALDKPTKERPFAYYVYGKTNDPDTWVLTEDDFFDYLIRTSKYDLTPLPISAALTGNSLLFLGFTLNDWKFRILFRIIMSMGGKANLANYNHVAVQLNPDENTAEDAVRTKKYFQTYFQSSKIDIYWGSAAQFLKDLHDQLATLPVQPEPEAAPVNRGW